MDEQNIYNPHIMLDKPQSSTQNALKPQEYKQYARSSVKPMFIVCEEFCS